MLGEERQPEQYSTTKRSDAGHILSLCVSQAGLRALQNLYRVIINHQIVSVCCHLVLKHSLFYISQLTSLIVQGPMSPLWPLVINVDHVSVPAEDETSTTSFVQNLVGVPHFTRRSFFSASGINMLKGAIDPAADVGTRASCFIRASAECSSAFSSCFCNQSETLLSGFASSTQNFEDYPQAKVRVSKCGVFCRG